MRPVAICASVFFCVVTQALAASSGVVPTAALPSAVTVIFDIKGHFAASALNEMRAEAGRIIGTSGIRLEWQDRNAAMGNVYSDLVVMTFKGSCSFDPAPPLYDETGPYATTRTANGEVQPFGEVDCDRVVNSVRMAMFGGDYTKADVLIGRALGRVVAHELVHMLTKSGMHAHEGVQKAALSGRQLISASLPLSAMDVDRLKQVRARQ